VVVNVYGSSNGYICDPDGVSTAVTFVTNPGLVPPLLVSAYSLTSSVSPELVTLGVLKGSANGKQGGQCKLGSRPLTECSNRGYCDFGVGECTCYSGWGGKSHELCFCLMCLDASTVMLKFLYHHVSVVAASDGGGGEAIPLPGNRQDCSYPDTSVINSCPRKRILL
jgi:hypothetical protein